MVHRSDVALLPRRTFDLPSLDCSSKTSGSKGPQVRLPLGSPTTYSETQAFARTTAELREARRPDLAVSRIRQDLRLGKLLLDWSQRDPHKTTVCSYPLRARDRPTASTPVTWAEVERCARRQAPGLLVFDAGQVLAQVERYGDLFRPVLAVGQLLPGPASAVEPGSRSRFSPRRTGIAADASASPLTSSHCSRAPRPRSPRAARRGARS